MSNSDQTVWNHAMKGNFALAKSVLAREMKIRPNTVELAAKGAFVLFKQGLRAQAVEQADKISDFSSLSTIASLQDVYSGCEEYSKLNSMFERAFRNLSSKSTTSNLAFEVLQLWYRAMLETRYTRGLLALNINRQKLLGDRASILKTVFSYYLVCWLPENAEFLSSSEKKLFPMLATKLLEKAGPLESAQEWYLKALVLSIQGDSAPLLEYLFDKTTIEKCPLLEMSLLRLETAQKMKKNDIVFSECKDYLSNNLDNWIHWKGLIESSESLGKQNEARQFISNYKASRNSKLALVALDKNDESKKAYFTSFGNKKCAYEDLRAFVKPGEAWIEDLHLDLDMKPANLNELIIQVNICKFKSEQLSVIQLAKLYHNSSHLLSQKDPKDYHPGDDFILLAVAKLLKDDSSNVLNIIKCIALLEHVAKSDGHQFYVRLWLVALYQLVGAYGNSLGQFKTLSVKNVQYESVSHFILARVGSLYPKETEVLKEGLRVYDEWLEMDGLLQRALEDGLYTKVPGMLEFKRRMERSVSQRIIDLEKLRVDRFSQSNIGPSVNLDLEFKCDKLVDSRDFDIMRQSLPDEYSDVYDILERPNGLENDWIEKELLRESLLRYGVLDINSKETLPLMLEKAEKLGKLLEKPGTTSEAEKSSYKIHLALVKILLDKENFALYEEASSLIKQSVNNSDSYMIWIGVHSGFTAIQTGKVVNGFVHRLRAAKQFKINTKGTDLLLKSVKASIDHVKEKALIVKNKRLSLFNEHTEKLRPWAEEVGLTVSHVEDVVDQIGASLDEVLTLLRK